MFRDIYEAICNSSASQIRVMSSTKSYSAAITLRWYCMSIYWIGMRLNGTPENTRCDAERVCQTLIQISLNRGRIKTVWLGWISNLGGFIWILIPRIVVCYCLLFALHQHFKVDTQNPGCDRSQKRLEVRNTSTVSFLKKTNRIDNSWSIFVGYRKKVQRQRRSCVIKSCCTE